MRCRICSKEFTRKSNLKRHWQRFHENGNIHHHGLQFVDAKYIKRELFCELHRGVIEEGKMLYCYPCNFSVCTDCLEEDCKFCNRDICIHKQIFIVLN